MGSPASVPQFVRAVAASVFAAACAILLGWYLHAGAFTSVVPGTVTLKVNTAVALGLASLALWLHATPVRSAVRRAGCVLAWGTFVIGAATIAQYLFGVDLGIDQLLIRAPAGEPYTSSPGRMGPNTACALMALGLALGSLDTQSRTARNLVELLACLALCLSLVAALGYAFGMDELYRVGSFTAMGLLGALMVAALSVGILAARPRSTWLQLGRWSLTSKLAALLAVTSIGPLTLSAAVEVRSLRARVTETAGALLVTRGEQLAERIDGWNRSYGRAAEHLAETAAALGCCRALNETARQALGDMLASRGVRDRSELLAAVLDVDGAILLSSSNAAVDGRRFAIEASARGDRITDIHLLRLGGKDEAAVAYVAPIGGSSTPAGFVVLWVAARGLETLMASSDRIAGGQGFAMLLDREGICVAHSRQRESVFRPLGTLSPDSVERASRAKRFGVRTRALLERARPFPALFERARAAPSHATVFHAFDPTERAWTYGIARRLETVPWTISALVPGEALREALQPIIHRKILLASAVMSLALLAGGLIAAAVLRPIRALASATERQARGDLSVRVPVTTTDEIGRLASSVGTMIERIHRANDELEARIEQRTKQLTRSEQDLATTLDSIGDAVIATDREGCVVRMNRVAERLTGWTLAEARGKPLSEIFRILDEETREPIASPVDGVLRDHTIVELAPHTVLVRRSGEELPIADSAAPIIDAGDVVRGVVLVFRDVTEERATQLALRGSEAKYRDLYENLADMCATVDAETEVIVECNDTLARQLGYSKQELLGRPLELLYEAGHEYARAGDRRAYAQTRELRDRERCLRRKNGSVIETSLSITTARDATGRLLAKGVWRDISARKQAERDRQFIAELSELRSLADPGELVARAAERLARALGVTNAGFVEDASQLDEPTRSEQQAGRTTVLCDVESDPRTSDRFAAVYAPSGVRASVVVPFLRGGVWSVSLCVSDDMPRAWLEREVALIQAVVERVWPWVEHARLSRVLRDKEAAELERRREEWFRIFVESVQDYAMFLLDTSGHIRSWNAGAERIKGYSAEEIIGGDFSVFYSEEDRARGHPEAVLRHAAETGRHAEEGMRVRKDGTQFWADVLVTALYDPEGNLEGFAKVTRDSTERRRVQEDLREREELLTAALREREVLLQEVHHRVKNNLQVISSLINLQSQQLDSDSARAALGECRARVEAIALIHERLYQAKDYADVPFSEYARRLCSSIFAAAGVQPERVRLELQLEDISLGVDQAVPCGLILNELITNSLKHAFPGNRPGMIRVELRHVDGEIQFVVADDGVGIPLEVKPDTAETLGMLLVTTLVEQLDGRLEIVRERGSAFAITFPAQT